jgi:hypothetical protein
MFDFDKIKSTFEWPVEVAVPTKNGGFERWKFTAEFHQMAIEEFRELLDSEGYSDKAMADKVLAGWGSDLKKGDEPLEYNDQTRAEVLAYIPAATGIAKGFMEAMNGDKARTKNS